MAARGSSARIGHLRRETSAAAAAYSLLGGLVDLIFLAPGPGIAAVARRLCDTGLDQTFLEEIKAHLRPGTSALVVLSGDTDLDEVRRVVERGLARGDVVLMHALLADGAPGALREAVHELREHRSPRTATAGSRTA